VLESELLDQVKTYLPDTLKEKFSPGELIQEIENSSGILRHRTAETYQFIHLTFQEYLTAAYINDNRDLGISKIIEQLSDPWWRETTVLLAGIMGNATSLVSNILTYIKNLTDTSERTSGILIAFACMSDAEVDDSTRNELFSMLVECPYQQVAEAIQHSVGPIEVGNTDLLRLLHQLLTNPYEEVQKWGLEFLNNYRDISSAPGLAEPIEMIFYTSLRRLHKPTSEGLVIASLPFLSSTA
jgi:hypothetical protein